MRVRKLQAVPRHPDAAAGLPAGLMLSRVLFTVAGWVCWRSLGGVRRPGPRRRAVWRPDRAGRASFGGVGLWWRAGRRRSRPCRG
jgi:hypothetical protein